MDNSSVSRETTSQPELHSHTLTTAAEWDRAWSDLSDYIKHHPGARHRRRIIGELLGKCSWISLADVGCGPGEMLLYFNSLFGSERRYCGFDYSGSTIDTNRKKLPWARFEELDICHESSAARFDVVVCSEVLEHLTDQRSAFMNLAAMTKPDGTLIISTPSGPVFPTEKNYFGHLHHPERREYQAWADDAGMRIKSLQNWGFPSYLLLKCLTNVYPAMAVKSFAYAQYSAFKRLLCDVLYTINIANISDSKFGCQIVAEFVHKS